MQLIRESKESHAGTGHDFRTIDNEMESAPPRTSLDEFAPDPGPAESTVVPFATLELDAPEVPSDGPSTALSGRIGALPPAGRVALVLLGVVCVVGAGLLARRFLAGQPRQTELATLSRSGAAAGPGGTVTFRSKPDGVDVLIGDTAQGKTPLTLTLPLGQHRVELRAGDEKRELPVEIPRAGAIASYYVEMTSGSGGPGGARVGALEILSEPAGAQVAVDGVRQGVTPLKLTDVSSGPHQITLSRGGTTIQRSVTVTDGSTASVVASINAAPAAVGWVSFTAPLDMKIYEDGALLGTTSSRRVMLPAGTHTFDLSNDDLEFATRMTVKIDGGNTATATVSVPNGQVSINARPWAEVFIDGQSVGMTPLANLAVPLGSREVVWRHPQLGERRRLLVVKAKSPLRVSVDYNE